MRVEHPITPLLQPTRRPRSPEEAARAFEEQFLKQLFGLMLRDALKTGLGADSGWLATQQSMQTDTLAEVLARKMADQGLLHLDELLLRQWQREGRLTEDSHEPNTPSSA